MKNLARVAVTAALLSFGSNVNAADDKHFDGGFAGGEAGAYLSELYYGAYAGFRGQGNGGLVYGIEGTLGRIDFRHDDNINISSVMGTVGWAFGSDRRNLIFASAGYAHSLEENIGSGVIAFALGYERALGERFSVRLKATAYELGSGQVTAGLSARF